MASLPPSTFAGSSGGHGTTFPQIVHTPGIGRVIYAPKEAGIDRLITGGDDYLVRLLPTSHVDSDQDPLLIEDATGPISGIDANGKYLIVASEDGSVRLYRHRNEGDDDMSSSLLVAVLTRTSLPSRCAALERAITAGKSPRAAICSDELIVKLVDVEDTKRVNLLTGHGRAVRAASWSPRAPILVTSSCDGTARVWDCSTAEPGCSKVIDNLPSTRPEDETDIHAEWHPSGDFFILPSKGTELVTYASVSGQPWTKSGVFSAPARGTAAVSAPIGAPSAMSFCPNGRFLAVATTDGQVTIWETSSRSPVRARKAESNVTGLSWHPAADALAWIDTSGQLTRWSDVLGSSYPSSFEPVVFGGAEQQNRAARSRIDELFDGAGLDDDDEEEEDDDLEARRGQFVDDEAHDGSRSRRRGNSEVDGGDGLEDFIDDDEGGEYSTALASERRKKVARSAPRPAAFSLPKGQSTFQPNSTPMRNSRRYLSLSMFGSLISIDQDTHHVVSFESFDSAARRNWKMVDHFGYSMASVAASGALLACPEKGESVSAVHFKPFEAAGAWSTPGAEWGVEMPKGEEIVAIAMGGAPLQRRNDDGDDVAKAAAGLSATAVIATSAGYLRFFSSSGLQRYVWSFGDDVVALAAGKQHALVVHRHSAVVDSRQNLSYTLVDLITFEVRHTGALAVGKDVQLSWIGFNELDIPVFYDSRGVMHLLDRAFAAPGQARWTPVLDSRSLSAARGEDKDEGSNSRTQFWPLAMSSTQMFCVFVRGAFNYPDPSANGHPLIQEVDLKIPLLNLGQPAADLEEKHLRQTLLASSIRSAFGSLVVAPTEYASDLQDPETLTHEADKDLLQLIQQSCKSDKHARALDATRELHTARMLDAALQIAGFFHLPSLAERMSGLREWVETRAERDERLERDGPAAVPAEEFSNAAGRSRVWAPSSQSPMPDQSGGVNGVSSTTMKHARRALAEDFHTSASTPRRSQQGPRMSFEVAQTASPAPTAASRMPPPAISASASSMLSDSRAANRADHDDFIDDEDDNDADQSFTSSSSSRKRKSPSGASSDRDRADKPFNKTLLGSTSSSALSTNGSSAANRNPFARQPGSMVRDRSMHKSTSFLDRAEADLLKATAARGSAGGAGAAAAKSKIQKQSTLAGFAARSARTDSQQQQQQKIISPSPAFGETQVDDDEDVDDETGDVDMDSESVQTTLRSASEREAARQRRGGLEETQAAMHSDDEDEEEYDDHEAEDEAEQPSSTSTSTTTTTASRLEAFRNRAVEAV